MTDAATSEILFSLTVYQDGRLQLSGSPRSGTVQQVLPGVLRTIADSVESGATVLEEP